MRTGRPRPSLAARRLRYELRWEQRRSPGPSLSSYLDARVEYDEAGAGLGTPPDVTATRGELGGVPVERIELVGHEASRTVLYVHGGAYVMGSLDASRVGAAAVARVARARTVNVGYRLAPEHPFPAPVDDVVGAYRALLEDDHTDPDRVVVVGSSAGGGLAVAALSGAREAGLPLPAAVVTLSAWADLRCTSPSYRTRARRDPALTPAGLRLASSLYLAGASPHQPLASPVLADLRGWPPLLALVGTEEILLHDTLALVERARACGVEADSLVGWGMVHCWTGFGRLPEATRDLRLVGDEIRRRTP